MLENSHTFSTLHLNTCIHSLQVYFRNWMKRGVEKIMWLDCGDIPSFMQLNIKNFLYSFSLDYTFIHLQIQPPVTINGTILPFKCHWPKNNKSLSRRFQILFHYFLYFLFQFCDCVITFYLTVNNFWANKVEDLSAFPVWEFWLVDRQL